MTLLLVRWNVHFPKIFLVNRVGYTLVNGLVSPIYKGKPSKPASTVAVITLPNSLISLGCCILWVFVPAHVLLYFIVNIINMWLEMETMLVPWSGSYSTRKVDQVLHWTQDKNVGKSYWIFQKFQTSLTSFIYPCIPTGYLDVNINGVCNIISA